MTSLHTVDYGDGITISRKVADTGPDERISTWLDEVAVELGMQPDDAASIVVAIALRQREDERAYQRVATTRGVLAL